MFVYNAKKTVLLKFLVIIISLSLKCIIIF